MKLFDFVFELELSSIIQPTNGDLAVKTHIRNPAFSHPIDNTDALQIYTGPLDKEDYYGIFNFDTTFIITNTSKISNIHLVNYIKDRVGDIQEKFDESYNYDFGFMKYLEYVELCKKRKGRTLLSLDKSSITYKSPGLSLSHYNEEKIRKMLKKETFEKFEFV